MARLELKFPNKSEMEELEHLTWEPHSLDARGSRKLKLDSGTTLPGLPALPGTS